MKPTITWIVIADGDKARVFEHPGPGKGLHALRELNLDQAHLRAHDIMADRPGRVVSSNGAGSRAAVDYKTDPVEGRERHFLEHLAQMLDEKRTAKAYDRLVIVAPPTALGQLRPALTDAVRATIDAELAKDLTKIPMDKLGDHLSDVMVV